MKSAIYARVSTADQDCGMQLRELREYAQRRGWTVAGEYVDTGWSGAKTSRPQFDRLMQDASKRNFDAVLGRIAVVEIREESFLQGLKPNAPDPFTCELKLAPPKEAAKNYCPELTGP